MRRSFVALHFAAGDLQRYTKKHETMVKCIIPDATDYNHQSFIDIVSDLEDEKRNVDGFIEMIEKNIVVAKDNSAWPSKIHGFTSKVNYALKFYQTTSVELEEIVLEIQTQVVKHHIKRLKKIGQVADEVNTDLGRIWSNGFLEREHGEREFIPIERLYCDTRDMAVNLLHLNSLATRLEDFVGKKKNKNLSSEDEIIELKPNIAGIGIDLRALIKWVKKKMQV